MVFECALTVLLTCGGCGPGGEPMPLRLLLKHQLAAGLDGVVFLCLGNVPQGARATGEGYPLPHGLTFRWTGHVQEAGQSLQEELHQVNYLNMYMYICTYFQFTLLC